MSNEPKFPEGLFPPSRQVVTPDGSRYLVGNKEAMEEYERNLERVFEAWAAEDQQGGRIEENNR